MSKRNAESTRMLGTAVMQKPPDGGWGWVVVFAAFATNVVWGGLYNSYGILYREFLNTFQEPRSYTSWIGSVLSGVGYASGNIELICSHLLKFIDIDIFRDNCKRTNQQIWNTAGGHDRDNLRFYILFCIFICRQCAKSDHIVRSICRYVFHLTFNVSYIEQKVKNLLQSSKQTSFTTAFY